MELVTKEQGYGITKVADLNDGGWLAVATGVDGRIHYMWYDRDNECMAVDSNQLKYGDATWDAVPKEVEMIVGIYQYPCGTIDTAAPRRADQVFSGDIMPASAKHLGNFTYVV